VHLLETNVGSNPLSQDKTIGLGIIFFLNQSTNYMKPRTKIKNCSVRIRVMAEPLGFKTLGSFQKFLKQCDPEARLHFGLTYMNAARALRLVDLEH
jgi:hypothetical protein